MNDKPATPETTDGPSLDIPEWMGPHRDQPGATTTYAALKAGEAVMKAISGLTPWAQSEVLQWAMEKVQKNVR